MNAINMPGFAAEAALYKTSGHYQMVRNYEAEEAGERILPQLPKTFCDQQPNNPCKYTCCTVDTIGPYGVPTISCHTDWICGHRNPGTGDFYGF